MFFAGIFVRTIVRVFKETIKAPRYIAKSNKPENINQRSVLRKGAMRVEKGDEDTL